MYGHKSFSGRLGVNLEGQAQQDQVLISSHIHLLHGVGQVLVVTSPLLTGTRHELAPSIPLQLNPLLQQGVINCSAS